PLAPDVLERALECRNLLPQRLERGAHVGLSAAGLPLGLERVPLRGEPALGIGEDLLALLLPPRLELLPFRFPAGAGLAEFPFNLIPGLLGFTQLVPQFSDFPRQRIAIVDQAGLDLLHLPSQRLPDGGHLRVFFKLLVPALSLGVAGGLLLVDPVL